MNDNKLRCISSSYNGDGKIDGPVTIVYNSDGIISKFEQYDSFVMNAITVPNGHIFYKNGIYYINFHGKFENISMLIERRTDCGSILEYIGLNIDYVLSFDSIKKALILYSL